MWTHKRVLNLVDFDYNRLMIWLRRGVVLVLSLLLLFCLLAGVAAIGLNNNFAKPDKLEAWLAESKIYDNLIAARLGQSQKSGATSSTSSSVSPSSPQVKQAAEQAFTPQLLRTSVNTILDSNYAWLSGKAATPSFQVNLSSANQAYAKQVGQTVETRLAGLAVCTPTQLAKIPVPADPLTVICRPASLDPKTEGARVAKELVSSGSIIKNPVITANNLGQEAGDSQNQPYYQALSQLPKVYKLMVNAPWVFGAMALLTTLGIIFIAPTRRRGARRIGVVLALAGLILLAKKFAADALVNFGGHIANSGDLTSGLRQPIDYLLHKIEPGLVRPYLYFGIAFVVIAAAIFITLFKTRQVSGKKSQKPNSPDSGNNNYNGPSEESAPEVEEIGGRLAPRRSKPAPPPNLTPKPPVTQGPPLLGKNPPRRKPPRLIQ